MNGGDDETRTRDLCRKLRLSMFGRWWRSKNRRIGTLLQRLQKSRGETAVHFGVKLSTSTLQVESVSLQNRPG
jgi:hypothetical protein